MKKFFYFIVGLIAFVLLAALLIPILFKDQIRAKIDAEISKKVNAYIYYDTNKFGLTLFRNFPNLTVQLGDFGVAGKDVFEGDTLIDVKSFEVTLDIMSVIKGDKISIKKIHLESPAIFAKVLADGRANWNIAIPDSAAAPETAEEPSSFAIEIKSWSINNANIIYTDAATKTAVAIYNLNHKGNGDFTQDIFDIYANTTIEKITVEMENISYLKDDFFEADMTMNLNLPESKYTFKENTFKLNEFVFAFAGSVAMPNEKDKVLDLTFEAKETSFKSLLSLIPVVYLADFQNLKTNGSFSFNGYAKGTQNETSLPAFGLNLNVKDAMFQFDKLPTAVNNIQIDMSIENKSSVLETIAIAIRNFHLELGKNPIDLKANIEGLGKMNIDANLTAAVNLEEIKKAFPVENTELKGNLTVNALAKGVYDTTTKSLPTFDVMVNLAKGFVKSKDFPAPLQNIEMALALNNATGTLDDTKVDLKNLDMILEGQPLHLNARIENLQNYTWDAQLKGSIDIGKMTKIFPVEGMTLLGLATADITTKGKMSDVEAGKYDQILTSGTATLKDFVYLTEGMPPIKITDAAMQFNPKSIQLSRYTGFLGKSDVQMSGTFQDYMRYVLKDETIKGNLTFTSNKFDVNEWMAEEPESTATADTVPLTVVKIPKNIDFVLASSFTELLYDNMKMTNMNGQIIVRNGTVRMNNLNFNMLGGTIATNGFYDPNDTLRPIFDFDLKMKEIDIAEAAKTFNTIKKLAPIAEKMTGKFSIDFKMGGNLTTAMMPDYSTITGGGLINILNAAVNNIEISKSINSFAKTSLPTNATLQNVLVKAEIRNGRAFFQPFDVNMGGKTVNISGSQGLDGTIDYIFKTDVPAGSVMSMASNLAGMNLGSGDVKVTLGATGNYSSPSFRIINVGTGGSGGNSVKEVAIDKAKEEADRLRKEAEDRARAEAEKARKEAEDRARAEQERLKKEAENKAKEELKKVKERFKLPR